MHLWVTKAGEEHPGLTSGTKAMFKKLLVALKKDDYNDVYREISSHTHNIMTKLSLIGRYVRVIHRYSSYSYALQIFGY